MNRRTFAQFAAVAGVAAITRPSLAVSRDEPVSLLAETFPGAIPLKLDEKIALDVTSTPFEIGSNTLSIISIDRATFRLSPHDQLTATVHASVLQWATLTYRISIAIFDEKQQLLGAASHDEAVQYIRLGVMPTIFRDIAFDFGVSKAFRAAKYLVIAVSEIDVPKDPKE